MRVRALLQVQETPVWTPASAKENNPSPGNLQYAWLAKLCGSGCICTVPVPALACDARREQQDTYPCCHELALMCMDMLRQVQIYMSHSSLL